MNVWRNIRDHHLTLGGGPWGGVAHRSREVFNPADGVQSVRLRRDLLDVGVDSAQSRVARDHRRGRVRRGDRAHRLQRSARRAGARRRGLVLLLLPERPARAHDLLALLQIERRDGARRVAVGRVRDRRRRRAESICSVRRRRRCSVPRCRHGASGAAHRVSVRRRSCDSRDAGAHGDVQGSRADSAVGGRCRHSREWREIVAAAAPRAPTSRSSASGAQDDVDHAVVADAAAGALQNPAAARRSRARPTMRRCARKCCISTISPSRAARSCMRPD